MISVLAGVTFTALRPIHDDRGVLTEVFRTDIHDAAPVQWNVVTSRRNVVRGFHAHLVHEDFLTVVQGSMLLGLFDLRLPSPTFGRSEVVRMLAGDSLVRIPIGVGHVFCFDEEATVAYGVTDYWNQRDELGCRWDDPGLGLDLPVTDPILSERDRNAGPLSDLMNAFAPAI